MLSYVTTSAANMQRRQTSPTITVMASVVQSMPRTVQEEDFVLPPPVVDLEDDTDVPAGRPGDLSEDGSEFDADEHDLQKDDTMVRSPCGTRWVHVSKPFSLDTTYSIWFESASNIKKRGRSAESYESGLQCIGTFSSVQDFWKYWNAIDLQRMSNFCSLSLFKHPIKPMWEDEHNSEGGHWIMRSTERAQAVEFFTKLALSLIGGYFECHDSLCGVVMNTKPKINSLSLWNKKVDPSLFVPVDYEIRELLGVENDEGVVVEYKAHGGSILNNQVQRGELPKDSPLLKTIKERGAATMAEYTRSSPTITKLKDEGHADTPKVSEAPVEPESGKEAATGSSSKTSTAKGGTSAAGTTSAAIASTPAANGVQHITSGSQTYKVSAAALSAAKVSAASAYSYSRYSYPVSGAGGYQYVATAGAGASGTTGYEQVYYGGNQYYYGTAEYQGSTFYDSDGQPQVVWT